MRRPRTLPDPLLLTPFDRAAAKEAGVTSGRLRSADVTRPYRGVQTTREPADLRERCEAYAVRMREGDCFSHITAALLHGLPVPGRLERGRAVDVTAVHPSAAPDARGVVGHRVRTAPPVVDVGGLRVVDVHDTWCQLAGTLEVADLVAIADHLLDLAEDPEQERTLLGAAIDRPGRYRTAPLRRALGLARTGSRSPQESRLRVHLVRGGLPEPELNAEVQDRVGRVLGHGDLVWRR